jgi:hypothetical protein
VIIDSASEASISLLWSVVVEAIVIRTGMDNKFQLWNSEFYSLGMLAYMACQLVALPFSVIYHAANPQVKMILLSGMTVLAIAYYFIMSARIITVAATSGIFILGTFTSKIVAYVLFVSLPSMFSIVSIGDGNRAIGLGVVRAATLIATYLTLR